MFGQYKRLRNEFTGVLTGKGRNWGGSLIRPEATGYGAVYFAAEMLETKGQNFEGKRVVISGSGNVAQHAAEKVIQMGGKVVTMSDSSGYIHEPNGLTMEQLDWIKDLKNVRRGRVSNSQMPTLRQHSTRANARGEWLAKRHSRAQPRMN